MTHEHDAPDGAMQEKQSDLSPGMIIALVIIVLAGVFIFQNTASSNVSFLWLDLEAPTWVWFIIMLLVGVAIGWLAHTIRVRRLAKRVD